MKSFKCHVCGSEKSKELYVNEIFNIEDKHILVEHISVIVCERCGEKVFSRDTIEKIRCMVHGESKPVKSISMDVFDYA